MQRWSVTELQNKTEEMVPNNMGSPMTCRCVFSWRSDKEPEGKVILRLWLCQQATNPHTKLCWPEAARLRLRHTQWRLNPNAYFGGWNKQMQFKQREYILLYSAGIQNDWLYSLFQPKHPVFHRATAAHCYTKFVGNSATVSHFWYFLNFYA